MEEGCGVGGAVGVKCVTTEDKAVCLQLSNVAPEKFSGYPAPFLN